MTLEEWRKRMGQVERLNRFARLAREEAIRIYDMAMREYVAKFATERQVIGALEKLQPKKRGKKR